MSGPATTDAWSEAEVRGFLAAHRPDLHLRAVRPMSGGYWNDVLRLDTDDGPIVLKHYRAVLPGTLFPNLPAAEAQALTALAGCDVAPDLLGYWDREQVLLYTYVEGTAWDGDVDAVADLLRRKSAIGGQGFRAVPMKSEGILAQGDALFTPCCDDPLTRHLRALRPQTAPPPPQGWCAAPRLIHTDIGATNLIGAGAGLRLIDWQCPASGDPAEDAYSFVSPAFQILNLRAPLPDAARARFLSRLDDPDLCARLAALEPSFAWRMAGYCCRRLQTAEDPQVRDRYARAARAEADHIEALTC